MDFFVSDEEILDVFSESVENSTVLRQDVIFARFSFSLHNGTLSLHHSNQAFPVPSGNGMWYLVFANISFLIVIELSQSKQVYMTP